LYANYKKIFFNRFNFFNNLSFFFFSKFKFFWYDYNPRLRNRFKKTYSVLNKFNINNFNFSNFFLKNLIFKKKFGFFKKDDKIKHHFLYKLNFLKNLSKKKLDFKFFNKIKKRYNKFVDLKYSSFILFYKNRKILKNFLFLKDKKQYKTTKILSKIIKMDFINFYKFFEFSIVNLIIRCKFCYNLSESIFFLKNGFIYLNGLKITNPLTQVNVGDLIQLSFSENYFNFFKVNTNNKLKSIFFLKHII